MAIDIEEAGSPNRKTKQDHDSSEEGDETSQDRARRVSVTPNDPEKLEEVAEKLGLPKSKVYNMAFSTLLENLGLE